MKRKQEEIITVITDQDLQSLVFNPIPLNLKQAGVDPGKPHQRQPAQGLIKNYGSASSAPINFSSKVRIKVKMTANPL
jgi:hypothetical protein